jgi:HEPN domain-containing protein
MQGTVAARYPGELANSAELLHLAEQYRAASQVIHKLGRAGDPLSLAPYRLNAIHAIELYLSALLLHAGHEPSRVRGLQHDLVARAELAAASGLKLRLRTLSHLRSLADTREYLISRYAPEATTMLSQVNRLAATLEEVAKKVGQIVGQAPRASRTVPN